MAITERVASAVFATGSAARTVTPDAGTAVGELMVLLIAVQDVSATTISGLSGWTARKTMATTGTLKTWIYTRVRQSGDTTWTYVPSGSVETAHVVLSIVGADETSLIVGGDGTRAASGGTFTTTAPSITTTVAASRVYLLATERTTANESTAPTLTNGFASLLWAFQNGTSAESLFIAKKDQATAGAVGATSATYLNSQGSNGYAVQIAVAPAAAPTVRRGFNSVAEMRAKRGATWAHRGGSASYTEHSLAAYAAAAARGYGVLELSMQRTSEGVWFGCHDLDLSRVTGGAAPATDVRTMTWAQVNAYQMTVGSQAPQPFMRWQDFIAAGYGNTHVLVLDPKNSVGSYQAEFLSMVAASVDPARVIMKWSGGFTSFADAAKAAGFKTAGYWYQADYDANRLAEETTHWDYLGMDYTATSAWTGPGNIVELAAAQGKKVWGHIPPSQAAYDTAMAKGADMVQVSGVAVVSPVSWWTSDLVLPSLTAAGSGAHTPPGANGSGNPTLPALGATGGGSSAVPVVSGTAAVGLPGLGVAGTGSRTVPVYSGGGAAVLLPLQAAGLGAGVPPIYVGSGTALVAPLAASGIGSSQSPAGVAGTGSLVLSGVLAESAGDVIQPSSTGLAAVVLVALTVAGAGETSSNDRAGAGALLTPELVAVGSGSITDPPPPPPSPVVDVGGAWPARAPGAEHPYSLD